MLKTYDELTFADDFMFCKIMQDNVELCKELVELVLNRKIGQIICGPEKQKPITITADGKGIRLDVYFEDDNQTVYDIEMQTVQTRNLAKRTRYYQAMMDLNNLKSGASYEKLKESYIVFICTFDPFHRGYHKYSFTNRCAEVSDLELGDGTRKIFLCSGGSERDVSEEVSAFLDYIAGIDSEGEFVRKLDREVSKARDHLEWRDEYMSLFLRDEEMVEKGRIEGRIEGQKAGENKLSGLIQNLIFANRSNEIQEAVSDEAYRKKLYAEFGIG